MSASSLPAQTRLSSTARRCASSTSSLPAQKRRPRVCGRPRTKRRQQARGGGLRRGRRTNARKGARVVPRGHEHRRGAVHSAPMQSSRSFPHALARARAARVSDFAPRFAFSVRRPRRQTGTASVPHGQPSCQCGRPAFPACRLPILPSPYPAAVLLFLLAPPCLRRAKSRCGRTAAGRNPAASPRPRSAQTAARPHC